LPNSQQTKKESHQRISHIKVSLTPIGSVKLSKRYWFLPYLQFIIYQKRIRIKQKDIAYVLHLYSNGLSLRNTVKALQRFVHRSRTAIRDWIQKYKTAENIYQKDKDCGIHNWQLNCHQDRFGIHLVWWVTIIKSISKSLSMIIL
jgi:hypothetical protein